MRGFLKARKIISLYLVFIMLISSILSGCDFFNSKSGKESNSNNLSGSKDFKIKPVSGSDKSSILKMAEAYYKEVQPNIEIDFKNEF